MSNQFNYSGEVYHVKEKQIETGWMYSCGIPIDGGMSKSRGLSLWLNGLLFSKHRLNLGERDFVTFNGRLDIQEGNDKFPPRLCFISNNVISPQPAKVWEEA